MTHTWLVTGANRGIGLEYVKQLAARGETVIAACRDPQNASELGKAGVRVVKLNVTDEESCHQLAETLRGTAIDVLINNAGVSSTTNTLQAVTKAAMVEVLTVNTVSPLLVTKALLPNLKAGKLKRIVNISSQLGSIASNTGGSSYGYRASKTALNQINRSLSHELVPDGFTCIAMHPGWVQTDMGGPKAPILPAQAVTSMLKTIDSLSIKNSGQFLNFDGSELAW